MSYLNSLKKLATVLVGTNSGSSSCSKQIRVSFLHIWLHLDHVPPLLQGLLVASHLMETKNPPALTSSTLPFSPSTPATPISSLHLDHSGHQPQDLCTCCFLCPGLSSVDTLKDPSLSPGSLLRCHLVQEALPDDSFEKNVTPPSHYPSPLSYFFFPKHLSAFNILLIF